MECACHHVQRWWGPILSIWKQVLESKRSRQGVSQWWLRRALQGEQYGIIGHTIFFFILIE